uniref:Uncharacterized protein n=1 Tax=Moniliophthora roreri TaxID=221103 RepID=A0A0W0GAZ2_MONRR
MARISSMEFQDLAASVVALHSSSDLYLHLSCVLECLWWDNVESETNTDTSSNDPRQHPSTENGRITAQQGNNNIPDFLCSPAILYFALVASFGRRDHSRIMVELGMLSFLRELECFDKRANAKSSRRDFQTLEVTSAESDNDIAGLVEDTISFTKSTTIPNGDKLLGNSGFRKASVPPTYFV